MRGLEGVGKPSSPSPAVPLRRGVVGVAVGCRGWLAAVEPASRVARRPRVALFASPSPPSGTRLFSPALFLRRRRPRRRPDQQAQPGPPKKLLLPTASGQKGAATYSRKSPQSVEGAQPPKQRPKVTPCAGLPSVVRALSGRVGFSRSSVSLRVASSPRGQKKNYLARPPPPPAPPPKKYPCPHRQP